MVLYLYKGIIYNSENEYIVIIEIREEFYKYDVER